MQSAVKQYTSESAPPLGVSLVEETAVASGREKYARITDAISKGQTLSESISVKELQGLIQASNFKDRLDVSMSQSQLRIRFSLPLAALGDWVAASALVNDIASRSIVGDASGTISVKSGKVTVVLSDLVLNGTALGEMPRGHAAEWIAGALEAAATPDPASATTTFPLERLSLELRDESIVVDVAPDQGH